MKMATDTSILDCYFRKVSRLGTIGKEGKKEHLQYEDF